MKRLGGRRTGTPHASAAVGVLGTPAGTTAVQLCAAEVQAEWFIRGTVARRLFVASQVVVAVDRGHCETQREPWATYIL